MAALRTDWLAVLSAALILAIACDDPAPEADAGADAALPDAGAGDAGVRIPRTCNHPVRSVTDRDLEMLVFTRTMDFRHSSIPTAVATLEALSAEGIQVTHTEEPTDFNDANLATFDVVMFLHTTGDVLERPQEEALERFVRSGGGFVGVHSAADTEYAWPWYGQLVGAYFRSHPLLPVDVRVTTEDMCHASTDHLEDEFQLTDEIYNFDRNPRRDNHILLTVDEEGFIYPNTDGGPSMGEDHPIAWLKEFDGGRSFYTNLGHRTETWADPVFMEHLTDGIRWAASPLEYSWRVITDELRNPLAADVAADGRVFVIERTGEVYVWSPTTGLLTLAVSLDVALNGEHGLLGIALDPAFDENSYVYLFHSITNDTPRPGEPPVWNVVARFTMRPDNTLDESTRLELIRIESEAECCHEGGAVDFGPDGLLYISTGDGTFPHDAIGYAPIDERPGREAFDAQRSAPNPDDLRGKILRINADGTIPAGNMFPADGSMGRPEIFAMGLRNPFRMTVDQVSGRVFWGDVGPDGIIDSPRGPRGFDEINFADEPGNYGWPYCIANNLPYRDYDFETMTIGEAFDCTGMVPALLYYDYMNTDYLALGDATDPESEPHPALGMLDLVGRTAIAGDFYRVPAGDAPYALPEPYRDTLLMADWTRDRLVSVEVSDDGTLGEVNRFVPFIPSVRPTDIAAAPDGAIYLVSYGTSYFGDNEDAALIRIEFSADGDLPPVAVLSATPVAGPAPLTVELSAAGSRAPAFDATVASYEWDVDADGVVDGTDPTISHTYTDGGTFQPTLVVVDSDGRRSLPMSTRVIVGNTPPVVSIVEPTPGTRVPDGTTVALSASVNDAEDGTVPCADYEWDIRLGHNSHSHPFLVLGGCTASFEVALPSGADPEQHFFAIELVYRDQGGPGGEPTLVGRDQRIVAIEIPE